LVDGPTLADRLVRGRLSQREALVIAAQIAEALEAAHEAGIVHRDLKSANIKMTSTGGVKVLDFGLAKMLVEEGSRADVSASPTITVAGTRAGVVLGTAAYMSPEQARGAQIDKRADVWAFGCVLFEMLTGRGAFAAETVPDTVVNVLTREPELDSLPSDTSPMVRSLLKRCLHKDQNRRMRDIGDAHFQIEEALTAQAATSVASTLLTGKARRGWAAALVVAAALIATAGVLLRRAPGELPLMRFSLVTPEAPNSFAFALAPDGRSLVYQSQADGQLRLWHREFDRDEAVPLGGTDRGDRPFWSPDSRSVAFFADGALKRIDLGSGFVRIVTAAPNAVRGAWSSEDTVLFGPSVGPLSRGIGVRGASQAGDDSSAGPIEPSVASVSARRQAILVPRARHAGGPRRLRRLAGLECHHAARSGTAGFRPAAAFTPPAGRSGCALGTEAQSRLHGDRRRDAACCAKAAFAPGDKRIDRAFGVAWRDGRVSVGRRTQTVRLARSQRPSDRRTDTTRRHAVVEWTSCARRRDFCVDAYG
jgi:hypothetical protein